MSIKLNSLEMTAEIQVSRQKSPINQYAVLYQIITNQTLLLFLWESMLDNYWLLILCLLGSIIGLYKLVFALVCRGRALQFDFVC